MNFGVRVVFEILVDVLMLRDTRVEHSIRFPKIIIRILICQPHTCKGQGWTHELSLSRCLTLDSFLFHLGFLLPLDVLPLRERIMLVVGRLRGQMMYLNKVFWRLTTAPSSS